VTQFASAGLNYYWIVHVASSLLFSFIKSIVRTDHPGIQCMKSMLGNFFGAPVLKLPGVHENSVAVVAYMGSLVVMDAEYKKLPAFMFDE
jgi:hypothetical protein